MNLYRAFQPKSAPKFPVLNPRLFSDQSRIYRKSEEGQIAKQDDQESQYEKLKPICQESRRDHIQVKTNCNFIFKPQGQINYLIPFLGNSISYLQKKRDMRMFSAKELLEADDKDGDNTD